MYTLLTPGQKIKEIRKQIGLNQQDIVGGQITRNMVSIIENDKSRLTPAVATIIAENINKICASRGIEYSVDEDYLLEDIDTQVRGLADEFIKYLDSKDTKDIKEWIKRIKDIDRLFMEHSVPATEFIVYFKIGRAFGDRQDYLNSYVYYIKALENSTNSFESIDSVRLLSDLGYTCIKLTRCKEALKYINIGLYYLKDTTDRLYYILHFNAALAYKKDLEYDYSFNELTTLIDTYKNLNDADRFEIYSLQANCLRSVKRYSEALQLHETLYSMIDRNDIEKRLIVLANLIDIHYLLNDTKGIAKVINRSIGLLDKYKSLENTSYTCQIYSEFGNAFYKIKNSNKALQYYWDSLLAARDSNNTLILSSSINKIIDIYAKDKIFEDIDTIKNLVIEYISAGLISLDDLIIYKLIKLYTDNNDIDTINSILEFILTNKK